MILLSEVSGVRVLVWGLRAGIKAASKRVSRGPYGVSVLYVNVSCAANVCGFAAGRIFAVLGPSQLVNWWTEIHRYHFRSPQIRRQGGVNPPLQWSTLQQYVERV